jgi:hypothetical protein
MRALGWSQPSGAEESEKSGLADNIDVDLLGNQLCWHNGEARDPTSRRTWVSRPALYVNNLTPARYSVPRQPPGTGRIN